MRDDSVRAVFRGDDYVKFRIEDGGEGKTIHVLRGAALQCQNDWPGLIENSFVDLQEELPITIDFDAELLEIVVERINELYRASKGNESAASRRKACGDALDEDKIPELMNVATWLGHDEFQLALQEKFASMLQELTPSAIRRRFNITSDMTTEDEEAAKTAPLLSPGAPNLIAPPAPPAPPALARSLSTRAGNEDAAHMLLGRCDGRTLRKMLGVSHAWAQRARHVAAGPEWIEATVVTGSANRTAHIDWAFVHGGDLEKLIRQRLFGMRWLRAGAATVDLLPLLREPVLTWHSLKNATKGYADEHERGEPSIPSICRPRSFIVNEREDDELKTFRHAAGLYAVERNSLLTTIGERAFAHCHFLTSVTLPTSLTSIVDNAFYYCTSLTLINLPEGVTIIGIDAFYGCQSLTSVAFPAALTSIGDGAFGACTSLTSVTGNKGLTSLGQRAFEKCTSLKSFTLPHGLTRIAQKTFGNCSSLTSVTIPESITSIEYYAFSGCTSLLSVDLPAGLSSIGASAFLRCKSLTSVAIPEGITNITSDTFRGCTSLSSVSFPQGLSAIGGNAFRDCLSLTSLTLPRGLSTIGNSAFRGCTSLTSVTLPESLTSIGFDAFRDCKVLTSVTFRNTRPDDLLISNGAFHGCPAGLQ